MIENLRSLLDSNNSILFVGIGNILKKDDGIGVYISNKIKTSDRIQSLTVEQSIENYIGKINSLNPDLLILIDCVNFNEKPGYTDLIPVPQLLDHTTNTHNISLGKISELFNMPVNVLGIQPQNVSFGEGFSSVVKKSADKIISVIGRSI